jgi:16S rRNA (guanine966-N2)-methyltransferase
MRVIGGKWRGRSLTTPDGQSIRPTGDRVREAIFNIVEHGRHTKGGGSPIPDAVVLDGFAGTGAMGIEAGQGMAVPALIALTDAGWIGDNALCMVEIGKGDGFDTPGGFEMLDERRYGAARVILLTRRAQTASAE